MITDGEILAKIVGADKKGLLLWTRVSEPCVPDPIFECVEIGAVISQSRITVGGCELVLVAKDVGAVVGFWLKIRRDFRERAQKSKERCAVILDSILQIEAISSEDQAPSTMTLREELLERYDELMFLEGPECDVAIVGVVERLEEEPFVCYDLSKVIGILEAGGMTPEEAEEWFQFNMIGAWVGPLTPGYLTTSRRALWTS